MSLSFNATSGTVVCLLFILAYARIPMNAKITRLACTNYDKQLISDIACSTKPINRTTTVANVYGHLARTLFDMECHLKVFKMANVYKPFLVDVKENFCHMMLGRPNTVYLKILYSIMEPYTNFNHTCPYTGEIIFKNLQMNFNKVTLLRDTWPAGKYRVDIVLTGNKNPSPTLKMEFEVIYEEKYYVG